MKRNLFFLTFLLIVSGLFSLSVFGQNLRATAFQIKKTSVVYGGKLFITVGGKQRKIDDAAVDTWIINGGREVFFQVRTEPAVLKTKDNRFGFMT